MGELLDVARYRPYGGNLHLLFQGWQVWSIWTNQNLCFDSHFIGNRQGNCTLWCDGNHLIHVRFMRCLETNITRRPFHRRMSILYLSNMRYRLSFIGMYPCIDTYYVELTYCKPRDCWNPLQLYAVHLHAAGFSLNWRCKLAVTHLIVTWSLVYNLQHFPLLFVIIFRTFPQQQTIASETLPPGVIGAE